MAELIAASGTQLDPEIVSVLVAVLERDERQTLPPRTTRVGGAATAEPGAALTTLDAATAAG
jgi:hypothetical protein